VSVDSLNVLVTCGFKSFFDQMRCTVLCETPAWRPMLRTLQRLRPFGGRVTSVTTRSTFFVGIEGLRPRPAASSSPASPRVSKRFDHVETRFAVVFNRSAISATPRPSSRRRIISARSRSRTMLVLARDRRRKSSTTAGSACKRLIGRAIQVIPPANQLQDR